MLSYTAMFHFRGILQIVEHCVKHSDTFSMMLSIPKHPKAGGAQVVAIFSCRPIWSLYEVRPIIQRALFSEGPFSFFSARLRHGVQALVHMTACSGGPVPRVWTPCTRWQSQLPECFGPCMPHPQVYRSHPSGGHATSMT
jgi:hypothetical protein